MVRALDGGQLRVRGSSCLAVYGEDDHRDIVVVNTEQTRCAINAPGVADGVRALAGGHIGIGRRSAARPPLSCDRHHLADRRPKRYRITRRRRAARQGRAQHGDERALPCRGVASPPQPALAESLAQLCKFVMTRSEVQFFHCVWYRWLCKIAPQRSRRTLPT
jgi:hypothetical protein